MRSPTTIDIDKISDPDADRLNFTGRHHRQFAIKKTMAQKKNVPLILDERNISTSGQLGGHDPSANINPLRSNAFYYVTCDKRIIAQLGLRGDDPGAELPRME